MTGQAGVIRFERFPFDPVAWDRLIDGHPEAEVFHSAAWLAYLAETQRVEPVVARITRTTASGQPEAVGYFVGGITRRLGLRILGSPLRGWGTQVMGFLLDPGVDRVAVARALPPFAFGVLRAVHLELADRSLGVAEMTGSGYETESGVTYRIDLTGDDGVLLKRMQTTARQMIRRAERDGLLVEYPDDADETFASEYFRLLTQVFARQGLAPTYDEQRVRALIRLVWPSGQLLLVRVRTADGTPVAAGISLGRNRLGIIWGLAFDRGVRGVYPNEPVWWETMRHWRAQGIPCLDSGGGGDYKAKYGGAQVATAWFNRPRFRVLAVGRHLVRRAFRIRQIVRGRLRSRRGR